MMTEPGDESIAETKGMSASQMAAHFERTRPERIRKVEQEFKSKLVTDLGARDANEIDYWADEANHAASNFRTGGGGLWSLKARAARYAVQLRMSAENIERILREAA